MNHQEYANSMSFLVDSIRASREVKNVQAQQEGEGLLPITQAGGFATYQFDLAGATGDNNITQTGGVSFPIGGYKILYMREGSDAGGLLDIELGGQILSMAPGDSIRARFDRFTVKRASSSVVVGTAVLLIVTNPQADYVEQSGLGRTATLSRYSVAQSAASATGNVPSASTVGLSLAGLKGLRVIVSAASSQTLSATGTLHFWFWDTTLARWMYNPELDVDLTAFTAATYRDYVLADRVVAVGAGRVFVEPSSVTVSAGDLTVTLLGWG